MYLLHYTYLCISALYAVKYGIPNAAPPLKSSWSASKKTLSSLHSVYSAYVSVTLYIPLYKCPVCSEVWNP